MGPGKTPEWLPEGLTNKGLVPVAADPPQAEEAQRAAPAEGRAQSPVPLEQFERVLGERIAEIERRIESRLDAVVADMKRALDGSSDRPPTPDPFARDGDAPALDGDVDSRLREAERRVTQAARATERNVDEVRRILGARLAASRWISDGDRA